MSVQLLKPACVSVGMLVIGVIFSTQAHAARRTGIGR